jgi:hypothetical protein
VGDTVRARLSGEALDILIYGGPIALISGVQPPGLLGLARRG